MSVITKSLTNQTIYVKFSDKVAKRRNDHLNNGNTYQESAYQTLAQWRNNLI
jgi:hypothetical protein